MSRLESLASLVPSQCLWGKLQNLSLLKVSKQAVMSFAWQAWHFVTPACFMTCQKSFCLAGALLLLRFQKMRCLLRRRCNTLETSDVILRGRRSTLDVSCCVFRRIPWPGAHEAATLTTPHFTRYTPHFTLSEISIPHFTLYTLHSTL